MFASCFWMKQILQLISAGLREGPLYLLLWVSYQEIWFCHVNLVVLPWRQQKRNVKGQSCVLWLNWYRTSNERWIREVCQVTYGLLILLPLLATETDGEFTITEKWQRKLLKYPCRPSSVSSPLGPDIKVLPIHTRLAWNMTVIISTDWA